MERRYQTDEERALRCRNSMMGFDDFPRALRLFMYEYGEAPADWMMPIASLLRAGHTVTLETPDGKRHVLQPERMVVMTSTPA